MSWIYHDSALEGVVYTFEELRTALSGQAPPVTDSSLQPTYDDIRRHKEAIEHVRLLGQNKKMPVTIDDIKKIYLILHPEEGDIKTVKYRKDIPQHRLYFHEYAPPDKIAYKVRQIVEWLNDPETRKTRNGIRIAARAHYDLLRVYPFPTDSGKVSRLFMNLLLMRSGLPPSIIHSTERQRYYEALKGSATTVLQMVQEAVENALSSVEKLLDEHETKKRAFVS
ncbi:MAG: Fic family protein [Minicystis sp.]